MMRSLMLDKWRRWSCAAALAGLALAAQAGPVDELSLRAAVIYKLMLYTEWPAEALQAGSMGLCVSTGSPLAGALRMLQGQPIGTLPLDVREAASDASLRRCQALYVDPASRDSATLARLSADLPMLVISDDSATTEPVVRLFVRHERIGFDIDLGQARRRGLRLSSRLLRLAGAVHE